MINRKFFFDHARATLFNGKLNTSQTEGLTAILDEWEKNWAKNDDRWLAYMLATAHHETDAKIQPIEEYGKGKNYAYGKKVKMDKKTKYDDTDNIFYGRGFVQLTWYDNYERAGRELGIDLIGHPEQTLELEVASQIMFLGMTQGWFTGRKLDRYFNKTTQNWTGARAIINGTDKANLIATYAQKYYACLCYTI